MAVPGQLWVPPLAKSTPLIFLDESQNPEKSEIITFEAFWAKNLKIDNFEKFRLGFIKDWGCAKMSYFGDFGTCRFWMLKFRREST